MFLRQTAVLAFLAAVPHLQAALIPLGQNRTLFAGLSGSFGGNPFGNSDTAEAVGFEPFNQTLSLISSQGQGQAIAFQNSEISAAGITVAASATSQSFQQAATSIRGDARSFTQFDFSIDSPMTFSGMTNNTEMGAVGSGFLLRIELFPLGSSTPIFSLRRTQPVGDPPFSMMLAPGSYRVEGELRSNVAPASGLGSNSGSFNFSIVPEPSAAGLFAFVVAAVLARRRAG